MTSARDQRGPTTRIMLLAAVVGFALSPLFPLTAKGCSCAMPSDLAAWVDESEAAFVGTLLDKRDVGQGQFGSESIYVFEVEQWVKGDAGEVIEVRSASDGAGCGFEFWDEDQRIGAVVHLENGELHGGLCSQVDPEVLLAAIEGPVASTTGIARLIAASGWDSTRLSVLDEEGGHIADLFPPRGSPEFVGTQQLEACPGRELMLQLTPAELVVWDLTNFATVRVHDLSSLGGRWVQDVSCRAPDASSIWILVATDLDSELIEVTPELTTVVELPGNGGHIGTNYVISQQDGEGDVTWVNVATGEQTALTATPPDELRSISVATHPTEDRIALVETRFDEAGPAVATMAIIDGSGETLRVFDIPWETYSPVWLDDDRVAVLGYDFEKSEQSTGLVFELDGGEMIQIENWNANYVVADGDEVYGVSGGSILRVDLSNGVVDTVVTLPTQSGGPLVLLEEGTVLEPGTATTQPSPGPTTPPLVAPELGGGEPATETALARWIAGVGMASFLGALVWLALRPPKSSAPS